MKLKDWKQINDNKTYKVEGTNVCISVSDNVIYSRPYGFGMFAHLDIDSDWFEHCKNNELTERSEIQEDKYNKIYGWED